MLTDDRRQTNRLLYPLLRMRARGITILLSLMNVDMYNVIAAHILMAYMIQQEIRI